EYGYSSKSKVLQTPDSEPLLGRARISLIEAQLPGRSCGSRACGGFGGALSE
ncbi:hypothetical protein KUCAC02_030343, partial [Chaenocephalus aceratus]